MLTKNRTFNIIVITTIVFIFIILLLQNVVNANEIKEIYCIKPETVVSYTMMCPIRTDGIWSADCVCLPGYKPFNPDTKIMLPGFPPVSASPS